jgi:hypothetical protein
MPDSPLPCRLRGAEGPPAGSLQAGGTTWSLRPAQLPCVYTMRGAAILAFPRDRRRIQRARRVQTQELAQ